MYEKLYAVFSLQGFQPYLLRVATLDTTMYLELYYFRQCPSSMFSEISQHSMLRVHTLDIMLVLVLVVAEAAGGISVWINCIIKYRCYSIR